MTIVNVKRVSHPEFGGGVVIGSSEPHALFGEEHGDKLNDGECPTCVDPPTACEACQEGEHEYCYEPEKMRREWDTGAPVVIRCCCDESEPDPDRERD